MTDRALREAHEILAASPFIDAHNDLPYVIRIDKEAQGDPALYRLDQRRNSGDTDIPRLREGRVAARGRRQGVPGRHARSVAAARARGKPPCALLLRLPGRDHGCQP